MSALEIELGPAGVQEEFRITREVIVPPYEPGARAQDEPLIELSGDDIVLETDDEPFGDIEVVVGEPIEQLNVVRQRADEVALVLRAFAEDLPVPQAGPPTLALSVATALMNIGCEIGEEHVRILRAGGLREFARPMPADVGEAIVRGANHAAAVALAPHVIARADDLLHARFDKAMGDALGEDACIDLSTQLREMVTTRFRQRCAERGDFLADMAWKPMHAAFRLYIGFTLAGLRAERGLVAPFVELIKNGHFPMGFLKDRTFLVITG